MSSFVLNRRVLLGGVTLFGVSSLLAACGQQASNEASASASSTAAPTETASASAVATDSPSVTPSTVRGYSGGSKAPDGEYRPADKYGNAQNVPKPPAPEEGYREKSISGLEKTIRAWSNWRNYAVETGNFTEVRRYVSQSLKSEINFYDEMSSLYQKGGWIIDGHNEFVADGAPYSEDGTTYTWRVYRKWNSVMYVQPDGSWESRENREVDNNKWNLSLIYADGSWLINGLKKVSKEQ